MDAFYASVEQRDFPAFRNKPLCVGGSRERGVVAAASYEARQYGIKSAMPSAHAFRLCPQVIFVAPRFEVYKKVSEQIRQIFFQYTDLVEPLSLDEAYLDVTEDKQQIKSATIIAQKIKAHIKQTTGLTASAGVSYNKFLAKIASAYEKPDGLKVILPEEAAHFLEQLPIEDFYGIGKVTAHKMHLMDIRLGKDLKQQSLSFLQKHFGKAGLFFYEMVRGSDNRAVTPNRIRKSIGTEKTFSSDLQDLKTIHEKLNELSVELTERISHLQDSGTTLTLKIKFENFTQVTRSTTASLPFLQTPVIYQTAQYLLQSVVIEDRRIRLLGLTISNLMPKKVQTTGSQLTIDFD